MNWAGHSGSQELDPSVNVREVQGWRGMAETWGRSTFSTVLGQICYVGYTLC